MGRNYKLLKITLKKNRSIKNMDFKMFWFAQYTYIFYYISYVFFIFK